MASALLDPKNRSIFTYNRVILFNYDVQAKKPFCSYNRNIFSEKEIPTTWFSGPLTPAHRKKVISLSSLGGGRFSVYGKIEAGTCNTRWEKIEKDLNETFQEFLDQDFRIEEAYGHMISARPSKVLSGWTFESKPKPLRSSRTAGEYRETEVIIIDVTLQTNLKSNHLWIYAYFHRKFLLLFF